MAFWPPPMATLSYTTSGDMIVGLAGRSPFAKLQALVKTAAERTSEALWATIGKLLDRFSPTECQNYIENAGYVRSA